MSLPLLSCAPNSQNQRVEGFEIPGDEQPRVFTTDNIGSVSEMDELITAAYRQIFHEQQMLKSNRQILLESQLRAGFISVKAFVQGLAVSQAFRIWNYEVNNNYRFVELCVQRLLGRQVYDEKEKLAWSIVLATEGIEGFINILLASEEYATAFGDNTVPYQRRRILPQRAQGDLPFERVPRYGQDHLMTLKALGYDFSASRSISRADWLTPPAIIRLAVGGLTLGLAGFLGLVTVAVVLSWFGWLHI
jgi:phycobilisome rod-core linker protein